MTGGQAHGAPPRPRVIFFDVGDTLVRTRGPHADLLAAVARECGHDLDAAALRAFDDHVTARVAERTQRGRPFTFPPAESRAFWRETYRGFLARLLPPADAERVARAYHRLLSSPAGYTRFDDAIPTLARLRAAGFRFGVLSNWEAWLPALLAETGLAAFFEHVVISGLCGVEKPDRRIFALALAEGGYRPEEVVYVGDSPLHDVAPALAAGIRPILLDRSGRARPDLPCRRIATLHELPMSLGLTVADGTAGAARVT